MLLFYCPGCHAEHRSNEAFAGRRAQCVRCGAAMRIPQTSGIAGSLIRTEEEVADEDMDIDELAEKQAHDSEAERPAVDADEPPPVGDRPTNWPKRLGVLLLVLTTIAVGYFAIQSGPLPKPAAKLELDAEEEPPPSTPAVAEKQQEIATAPTAPPPETPIRMTADQLAAEYATGPQACDTKYRGKLLEVEGICKAFGNGGLQFRHMYSAYQELAGTEEEGVVTAALPAFDVTPLMRETLPAIVGSVGGLMLEPPSLVPQPGRGVTVRGRYAGLFNPQTNTLGNLRLDRATVVRAAAPADEKYTRRTVSVTGLVTSVTDELLGFEPPGTATLLQFEAYFRPRQQPTAVIRPGQIVTITGTCSGRSTQIIRFDNCVLGGGGTIATTTAEMVRDYEIDLQTGPPIDRSTPIVVTAENLAREFQENRTAAMAKYGRKYLAVTGAIARNDTPQRLVTFEKGTDVGVSVLAAFTRLEYGRLPTDELVVSVRGVCYGLTRSRLLRIEDSVSFDPDNGNPNVPRLTADFFPLKAGAEWTAVRLLEPNPPPLAKPPAKPSTKPAKPPAYAVAKLRQKIVEDGRLVTSLVQQGTTTDTNLATATIKWTGKPAKTPTPVQDQRFRIGEKFIETGTLLNPPPAQPKTVEDLFVWSPVLRLGAKPGREWSHEEEVGGNVSTWTATKFFTDPRGRPALQVDATLTSKSANLAGVRQITTTVFVKGVGPVSQKVVLSTADGTSKVVYEELREESEAVQKKETELRGSGGRVPAPPPREAKSSN
ncbi:OB-fold protein [Limnoglobus roseus]|uniref:Uncharacterized protein n=1 Tax=Limnoglobus roseus TaxID=2598579 RepID=A0A5C1AGP3_9BACT|nr:hypothetical protein [Limnoglobus roseus]QEL18381.1 hypothetical protein PX52LOC_05404 [Limnoglobus roseus]